MRREISKDAVNDCVTSAELISAILIKQLIYNGENNMKNTTEATYFEYNLSVSKKANELIMEVFKDEKPTYSEWGRRVADLLENCKITLYHCQNTSHPDFIVSADEEYMEKSVDNNETILKANCPVCGKPSVEYYRFII
jgi:hypothetical protein